MSRLVHAAPEYIFKTRRLCICPKDIYISVLDVNRPRKTIQTSSVAGVSPNSRVAACGPPVLTKQPEPALAWQNSPVGSGSPARSGPIPDKASIPQTSWVAPPADRTARRSLLGCAFQDKYAWISKMILAGNFQGFSLLGADVLFGTFDAGMAEQQLGRAQVAGLKVDMGRKGPAQRM